MNELPKGFILIPKHEVHVHITEVFQDEPFAYIHNVTKDILYYTGNFKDLEEVNCPNPKEGLAERAGDEPVLKLLLKSTVIREANIGVYQVLNPELPDQYFVNVELKEGYTSKDIPWLPKQITSITNHLQAMRYLYSELRLIYDEEKHFEDMKDEDLEEPCCLEVEVKDCQSYSYEEIGSKVYTVETRDGQVIMATDDKQQAFSQALDSLEGYTSVYVVTWLNGDKLKTVRLQGEY